MSGVRTATSSKAPTPGPNSAILRLAPAPTTVLGGRGHRLRTGPPPKTPRSLQAPAQVLPSLDLRLDDAQSAMNRAPGTRVELSRPAEPQARLERKARQMKVSGCRPSAAKFRQPPAEPILVRCNGHSVRAKRNMPA